MSATETPSKQKRRLLSDPSSKPRIEHQRSSSVSSLGTSNSNSSRPSDDQELKSKKARFSTFQIHIEDINAVGAEDDKKTRRKTSRRKSSKKPGPVYCEKKSKSSTAGDSEDEEETDYWEVERIQKYSRDPESGKEKFFPKWKGWPLEDSTWEPNENMENCQMLINEFAEREAEKVKQTYLELFKRPSGRGFGGEVAKIWLSLLPGMKTILHPSGDSDTKFHLTLMSTENFGAEAVSYAQKLGEWEKEMNKRRGPNEPKIIVENNTENFAEIPKFEFINDYVVAPGVPYKPEAGFLTGCECKECGPRKSTGQRCCPENEGKLFAYDKDRRIRVNPGQAVYECNSMCRCSSECRNRVVQRGETMPLVVFHTGSHGWGLKASEDIFKGTFVIEYFGEMISLKDRPTDSLSCFVYDLDFVIDPQMADTSASGRHRAEFAIDATQMGNLSRFINHSCAPNLAMYCVFVDNVDARTPRLALFARRRIRRGEELTFDYRRNVKDLEEEDGKVAVVNGEVANSVVAPNEEEDGSDDESDEAESGKTRIICRCQAPNCRGYLWT